MFGISPFASSLIGGLGLCLAVGVAQHLRVASSGGGLMRATLPLILGVSISISVYLLFQDLVGALIGCTLVLAAIYLLAIGGERRPNFIVGESTVDESLAPDRRAELESIAEEIAGERREGDYIDDPELDDRNRPRLPPLPE